MKLLALFIEHNLNVSIHLDIYTILICSDLNITSNTKDKTSRIEWTIALNNQDKLQKFSIRKYAVGTFSTVIATLVFIGFNPDRHMLMK